MRKVLGGVLALLVLLVAGFFFTRWLAVWKLNATLVDQVLAAWTATEPRNGTANENGFQCVAELPDEKGDLKRITFPLLTKWERDLPPEGLPPEIVAMQPWADQFRACADAKGLRIVPLVFQKSSFLYFSLEKITRIEMRAALQSKDSEKAARLCVGTLEVVLDRSFLGFEEALGASRTVQALVSPCATAIQGLSPELRAQVSPRFATLNSRLISTSRAYERDWIFKSVQQRYALMNSDQQTRVPAELGPRRPESFMWSLAVAGSWSSQDAAVKKFLTVADTPGSARAAAAADVEQTARYGLPLLEYHGELDLSEQCQAIDTARDLLGVLAQLAAGVAPATPMGMTRTASGLEYKNIERAKAIVPIL